VAAEATPATSPRNGGAIALLVASGGRPALKTVVLPLLVAAAVAWTFTMRGGSGSMDMSAAGFVSAWIVMMVAMMLPAVAPVVGLYTLAARRGLVAAVPFFLGGYLIVWAASAIPAYAVARGVDNPLMQGDMWAQRLVGGTLVAAALFQLTPLKEMCLQHCRSPLSFFMAQTSSMRTRPAAMRAGVGHGLYCLGCCWALMAILVVLGGMQLAWALGLAAIITVEKLAPWGAAFSRVTSAAALGLGVAVLISPSLVSHLIAMPSAPMSM
jgi:predicted metal-binding membrane protein